MFGLRVLQKAPQLSRAGAPVLVPAAARIGFTGAPARLPALAGPAQMFARAYSDGPAPLTKEFVFERISGVLSNCDKIDDPAKIVPTARLEEDLGLDSLDVVDALFFVEEEFTVEMPDHEADEIKTVQDVVDWVYNQPDAF